MAYLKFKADKIFDGNGFLDDKKVLITDESGTIQEILSVNFHLP